MSDPDIIANDDLLQPAHLLRPGLPQSQKVVLVLDLVESVRLINLDESGTINRWHDFVQRAQAEVIPAHGGRLVKSLGDGLMVEFNHPPAAVHAAFALHGLLRSMNALLPSALQLHLRAGINCSVVYTDRHDIYGAGVNLAARIATLAGPGETVISAAMRDSLTDRLDATLDDLGECFLKHIDKPLRVYRVGPAGAAPVLPSSSDYAGQLQPTLVVIPFASRSLAPEHFAIGELIADVAITQLSQTHAMRVISRLSSSCFRHRADAYAEMRGHLAADFALSGSYLAQGEKLRLMAELVDLGRDEVVWASTIAGSVSDLLSESSDICHQLASAVEQNVLNVSLQRVRRNPLPTVASYALMLAGIGLMHQSTRADFELSRRVLEQLLERHTRSPAARAWLAQWHVLRATRGFSNDLDADAQAALEQTRRALDEEPNNSLALAMDGFACCHLKHDLGLARERLALACSANPNEALAWLFQSVVLSFSGEAELAQASSDKALALSPLDPMRYYYESLAASSAICAGDHARAKLLCQSSLRQNRTHASTLRALITALVGLGDEVQARAVAVELLRLDPGFTVDNYRSRAVSAAFPFGQGVARALAVAGIPLR